MLQEEFAQFTAGLSFQALPASAIHAARRCTLDWFAATIPGGVRPPATLLAKALDDELDHGGATLIPSGRTAPVRTAALINGTASHTVEFDDIFSEGLYHPGAPVIAAALAVAESRRVSGSNLLTAVIAGYEVSNRIGAAVNPSHYEFWHTTGTVGVFGAAAAAARVLSLDAGATAHALANAATMAAGLQQAFRAESMTKPLHAGRAAEAGALTALAAAKGVSGAPEMIEGTRGFGAAMSQQAEWDGILDGLGTDFTIERTTQKNYAACGHTFAAIDGLLTLRDQYGLQPRDVREITVSTYRQALDVAGNPAPRTPFESKFSIPYCVAVALLDGQVRLEAFAPEKITDAAVGEVMAKVNLEVSVEADAVFPHKRAANVQIALKDGPRIECFVPTRKGEPDNPLSDSDLTEKFRELVAPVVGDVAMERLLENLWRVDELDDVTALHVTAQQPVYSPKVSSGGARRES